VGPVTVNPPTVTTPFHPLSHRGKVGWGSGVGGGAGGGSGHAGHVVSRYAKRQAGVLCAGSDSEQGYWQTFASVVARWSHWLSQNHVLLSEQR